MDTTPICSGCKKPLTQSAPQGLCPECLLKAGLGSGMDIGPDSRTASGRLQFVAPPLEEIARLFPQLEILSFIGQGGMGAVYRARQKELDRVVALKVLPPDIGKDPTFSERFTREARALAKLNHPGIVTLYEFGRADGLFFFLMEFVEGVNLGQLLAGGHLSSREALAIVPQICEALQYAHDQGIVHRDIKPQNILVDRRGRVKVADFGLAKLAGGEDLTNSGVCNAEPSLTEAGKVMGTPQYMAPEQRDHPTEVDHRADIYSLGVVFYQMLTGELPGKTIAPPSRKVQVDVRLDDVVLRALEKEPERRYQQASQVKTDVETIAKSPDQAQGTPPSAPELTKSWRRHFHVKALCFFFGAVCFLIAAVSFFTEDENALASLLSLLAVFGFSIAGYRYWQAATAVGQSPPEPPPTPERDRILREVRPPAIGLLVAGILNWLAMPLVLGIALGAVKGKGALSLGIPLTILSLSSFIIYAALKMMRLEDRRTATVGPIIAAILPPGNIIGMPIGIWGLVTMTRPHVRAAFKPSMEPWFMPKWGMFLAVGLLGAYALHLGGKLLGHSGSPPSMVVTGRVLDADSGKPIVGALVSDNHYGTSSTRPPRTAWTCDDGLYTLRTWPEEHTISAAASGYETRLETLMVSASGKARSARIDFHLTRTNTTEGDIAAASSAATVHSRKFVRLEADQQSLTFEGQPTSWEKVGKLLGAVPDRERTVLEFATASDQISVAQQNEWIHRANTLAREHGFEYASFVGVHPLGSKATPQAAVIPITAQQVSDTNLASLGFEVVALASTPRAGMTWWRPDGAILQQSPGDRLSVLSGYCPRGASPVEFAVLTKVSPTASVESDSLPMFDPCPEYVARHELFKGSQSVGQAALVGYRMTPTNLTCRIASPDGDWERVATWDKAGIPLSNESGGKLQLVRSGGDGTSCMKLYHQIYPGRYAVRIAARLENGQHMLATLARTDFSKNGLEAQVCALFNGLQDEAVIAYELYRVPLRWAAIHGIATKPDIAPLPQLSAGLINAGPKSERPEIRKVPPSDAIDRKPQLLAELLIAEVPADFQLAPGNMDRDRLLDMKNVQVLCTPKLQTSSGEEARLQIASIPVPPASQPPAYASPPDGVTIRLLPELKGDQVSFSLHVTITAPTGEGDSSARQSATQDLSTSAKAPLQTPALFEIGKVDGGRRRVGSIVFTRIEPENAGSPAPGLGKEGWTLMSLPESDRNRALVLFNDIEDFGHEFQAAFQSTNLAAAQTGVRRLLHLLTNFNAAVKGTDLQFSPSLFEDVTKVRKALEKGNWDEAARLAKHNETHAREFKRITKEMVALARTTNALAIKPAVKDGGR